MRLIKYLKGKVKNRQDSTAGGIGWMIFIIFSYTMGWNSIYSSFNLNSTIINIFLAICISLFTFLIVLFFFRRKIIYLFYRKEIKTEWKCWIWCAIINFANIAIAWLVYQGLKFVFVQYQLLVL